MPSHYNDKFKGPKDYSRGFSFAGAGASTLTTAAKYVPALIEYNRAINENADYNDQMYAESSEIMNRYLSDEEILTGIKENGNFKSTNDVRKAFSIEKMKPKKGEANKQYAKRWNNNWLTFLESAKGSIKAEKLIETAQMVGSDIIPGQTKAFKSQEKTQSDQISMKNILESNPNSEQLSKIKLEQPELVKEYKTVFDELDERVGIYEKELKDRDTNETQKQMLLVVKSPTATDADMIDTMMRLAGTDKTLQQFGRKLVDEKIKERKYQNTLAKEDPKKTAVLAKKEEKSLLYHEKEYQKAIDGYSERIGDANEYISELDPKKDAGEIADVKGQIKGIQKELDAIVKNSEDVKRYISAGTLPQERFESVSDIVEPVKEKQGEDVIKNIDVDVDEGLGEKTDIFGQTSKSTGKDVFGRKISTNDEEIAEAIVVKYDVIRDGTTIIGKNGEEIGKVIDGDFIPTVEVEPKAQSGSGRNVGLTAEVPTEEVGEDRVRISSEEEWNNLASGTKYIINGTKGTKK